MAYFSTIPTKAAVELAWKRYCDLAAAIEADPETRTDVALQYGLKRAHARFCILYERWNSGRA
jgi:hypothetical protein